MRLLVISVIPPTFDTSGGIMMCHQDDIIKNVDVSYYVTNCRGLYRIPSEYKCQNRSYCFLPKTISVFRNITRKLNIIVRWVSQLTEKVIINQAVKLGRKNKIDKILAIIQDEPIIMTAHKIAEILDVPILTQVWDDPTWSINLVNKSINSKISLKKFDQLISSSKACATASTDMAQSYNMKYGVKTYTLLGSLPSKLIHKPLTKINSIKGKILIGYAGQLYAKNEWDSFLQALDSLNWRINGKEVEIWLFGNFKNLNFGQRPIINMGYLSQPQVIDKLSKCSFCYLPYWFSDDYRIIAKTSFPSKLSTYLASGVPVFYHGPLYASVCKFLIRYNAAKICDSMETYGIHKCISELMGNKNQYITYARNGFQACKTHLSMKSFKSEFIKFIYT